MNQSSVEQKIAVKLEHVSFSYGKTLALNDFSLEIASGRLVGLIGPDGVGKSTMLSLITGARAMQETGTIEVLNGDMRSKAHRDRVCPKIAYMPQGLGKNLYFTLTVRQTFRPQRRRTPPPDRPPYPQYGAV